MFFGRRKVEIEGRELSIDRSFFDDLRDFFCSVLFWVLYPLLCGWRIFAGVMAAVVVPVVCVVVAVFLWRELSIVWGTVFGLAVLGGGIFCLEQGIDLIGRGVAGCREMGERIEDWRDRRREEKKVRMYERLNREGKCGIVVGWRK